MALTSPQPQPADSLHPMDAVDREIITGLLQVSEPAEMDTINASRLLIRYRDSLLSRDLYDKLMTVLTNWNLTPEELQEKARCVWFSGWRPHLAPAQQTAEVGSGSDVEG